MPINDSDLLYFCERSARSHTVPTSFSSKHSLICHSIYIYIYHFNTTSLHVEAVNFRLKRLNVTVACIDSATLEGTVGLNLAYQLWSLRLNFSATTWGRAISK